MSQNERLISAEKAYEMGHRTPFHIGIADLCDLKELLADVPTVDAVEVPCRCKECRYSVQDHPYDPMECMKWKTKWGVAYTTPDGYCHKGERKSK